MTSSNPTDRGKLGTKRNVLTDQLGIPLSVVITSGNTHDMKAATDTLDSVVVERPLKKQNLCLDKGYDFPKILDSVHWWFAPLYNFQHLYQESLKEDSNFL
jgi:hypothetical protein